MAKSKKSNISNPLVANKVTRAKSAKSKKSKMATLNTNDMPVNPLTTPQKKTKKSSGRAGSKRVVAKKGASVVPQEAKIKQRFVLCLFNPKINKLVGTYLDYEHASNVTGLAIADIKEDVANGTEKTGGVWIKAPVGNNVNHRIINKIAREKYKKIRTVKRGRRPIDIQEATKTVKGLDISTLDEASIKKINRILKSADKNPKKGGKKVVTLAQ